MKRKIVSLIVCMALAVIALSGVQLTRAEAPHVLGGDVGPVDPNDPASFMSGWVYDVDDVTLPILSAATYPSLGGFPAYWDANTFPDWDGWNNTEGLTVLETIIGINGWAGTENYTGSTDSLLLENPLGVIDFPATNLYAIPTIAATFTAPDTIDLTWIGMADDMGANIVNYTVYESFNGGPFAAIGISTPQVIGGDVSFAHTPVTYGEHCYNIGVNYRRDRTGGIYTTMGRSTTICMTLPTILSTFPVDGMIDVALDAPIMVNFSHSMYTTTWKWSITPDPMGWTELWTQTTYPNDTVTLTHSNLFVGCVDHTVFVEYANETGGQGIVPGPVPNPWTFTTVCINPQIVSTSPSNAEGFVILDRDIIVQFSKEINTTTFTWTIIPDALGWAPPSWNAPLNDTVTLSHSNLFAEVTMYCVEVLTANDTLGNPLTPGLVPNPWCFNTTSVAPFVLDTNPVNGAIDVPLNPVIHVNYSEDMDDLTVALTTTPLCPDAGGWTPNKVTELHYYFTCSVAPFGEGVLVPATALGSDLQGLPVEDTGPVPNPWTFTTIRIPPTIISTSPFDGETGVALTADVIIDFSEPIDYNNYPFLWSIVPAVPGVWTETWSNGDQTVTMAHATDFQECTQYTVTVTDAYDIAGNNIVPSPYSWSFWTLCLEPVIVDRSPPDGATAVPLDEPIVITFDKQMNTTTLTVTVTTDPCPGQWVPSWNSPADTILTLTHPPICPFDELTLYSVDVDGYGTNGQPLNRTASAPLPWTFTTVGIPPTVVEPTIPYDGETQVALVQDIIIQFNETMDTVADQFVYSVTPSPGGLSHSWSQTVDPDDTVTIIHNDFTECLTYTVEITAARDDSTVNLAPLPYQFTFTAFCVQPMVVSTDPADGATMVSVSQDVIVKFSEPMNTTTVTVSFDPIVGNIQYNWDAADMNVTIIHDDFAPNTVYLATVVGQDLDANSLIAGPVPNPFSFTTASLPPDASITAPAGGEVWSGDTSHDIAWTMQDDSSTDDALEVWLNYTSATAGDGTIAGPLTGLTAPFSYTWTVACIDADDVMVAIEVYDEEGQLGTNTSQAFTIDCTAPQVSSTTPADATTNVLLDADIVVTFSEGMDNTSLDWSINPDPLGWGAPVWSGANTVVTLSHSNAFTAETQYTVTIRTATKDDSDPGIGLAEDYVFNFTTIPLIPNPPENLGDRDVSSSELTLTWEAPTEYTNGDSILVGTTIAYAVYRAETAGGPETEVATDLSTLYYTDTDVEAGQTYYYRVTATIAGQTSDYSAQHSVAVPEEVPPIDMMLLALILLIIIIIIVIIAAIALKRRKPEEIEEVPPPPEEVVEEVVEEVPPEEEVPEEVVEEAPPEEEVPEEVVEEAPPEEEAPAEEVVEEAPVEAPPEAPVEEAVPAAAVVAEEAPPAEEPEEAPAEGKVCPNCGTIVGEDDTTCFICGTEL